MFGDDQPSSGAGELGCNMMESDLTYSMLGQSSSMRDFSMSVQQALPRTSSAPKSQGKNAADNALTGKLSVDDHMECPKQSYAGIFLANKGSARSFQERKPRKKTSSKLTRSSSYADEISAASSGPAASKKWDPPEPAVAYASMGGALPGSYGAGSETHVDNYSAPRPLGCPGYVHGVAPHPSHWSSDALPRTDTSAPMQCTDQLMHENVTQRLTQFEPKFFWQSGGGDQKGAEAWVAAAGSMEEDPPEKESDGRPPDQASKIWNPSENDFIFCLKNPPSYCGGKDSSDSSSREDMGIETMVDFLND